MLCFSLNIFNGKNLSEEKKSLHEKKNMDLEIFDLNIYKNNCFGALIIGGGPAGLSAATYCSRFGIPTGVIMGQEPGGALMKTGIVENWPGIVAMTGPAIIESCIKQAQNSKAIILYEYVMSIIVDTYPFKIITNKNIYYAFSIMIATGSTIKKLGCPGEETYWGKGVSSCAICDGGLHKGKSVLVVGGGDSACEEALQLIPHADNVYVLVRGSSMRASQAMQDKIQNHKKINILYNTQIKEIIGNGEVVSDAILLNDGVEYLFSKKYPTNNLTGVFIAIGHTPNINLVKNIVDIDHHGLIIRQNGTQKTSMAGVFCAGDVCNIYRQAGVAAGEGSIGAIDIFNYLSERNINTNFYEKNISIWVKPESNFCSGSVCTISGNNTIEEKDNPFNKINIINTEKEYQKLIAENTGYYVLDIFGSNCPACEIMKKTINQYIKKNPKLAIYFINYEKVPLIRRSFSISGVPYLVLMKNGKAVSKRVGYMNLEDFEEWINKYTKK
jgi:thioredoxin reductase (NADPH)